MYGLETTLSYIWTKTFVDIFSCSETSKLDPFIEGPVDSFMKILTWDHQQIVQTRTYAKF